MFSQRDTFYRTSSHMLVHTERAAMQSRSLIEAGTHEANAKQPKLYESVFGHVSPDTFAFARLLLVHNARHIYLQLEFALAISAFIKSELKCQRQVKHINTRIR